MILNRRKKEMSTAPVIAVGDIKKESRRSRLPPADKDCANSESTHTNQGRNELEK